MPSPHLDELLSIASSDAAFGCAVRLMKSHDQAEDLVQDVILRIIRFQDKFRPGSNPTAWVMTILRNCARNVFRGAQVRAKAEALMLGEQSVAEQLRWTDPSEAVSLCPEVIPEAAEALPAIYREVLDLVDVRGLEYKEAAAELGCPVGTVMSRLHRARRALQPELADIAEDYGIIAA